MARGHGLGISAGIRERHDPDADGKVIRAHRDQLVEILPVSLFIDLLLILGQRLGGLVAKLLDFPGQLGASFRFVCQEQQQRAVEGLAEVGVRSPRQG